MIDEVTEPPPCPDCGGTRIQALLWVELASGEVIEDGDGFDTHCWCPDCDVGFRVSVLRLLPTAVRSA